MKPEFKLTFEDNEEYKGQSLNKDWGNAPSKKIKEFVFSFAGVTILLKNYNRYNHLFETMAILGGKKGITKFLIMGVKDKTTDIFEYNIVEKKFYRKVSEIGKEYRDKELTIGWKDGIKNGKAEFHYVK